MKKRESTIQQVANLTGQLNIGRMEARVHLTSDSIDESGLIAQATKLSAKGDGLPVHVHQEEVTDENGAVIGVDIVCRQKVS